MAKKIKQVEEVMEEAKQPVKVEKPQGLIAYADFSLKGMDFKEGEVVKMPAGYERDKSFDEQRGVKAKGVSFVYEGAPIRIGREANGKEIFEKTYQRVTLPLEEA